VKLVHPHHANHLKNVGVVLESVAQKGGGEPRGIGHSILFCTTGDIADDMVHLACRSALDGQQIHSVQYEITYNFTNTSTYLHDGVRRSNRVVDAYEILGGC